MRKSIYRPSRRDDTEAGSSDEVDLDLLDPTTLPSSARVHDSSFPARKRGEGWKIAIEDLIFFSGSSTVGLDDAPEPGYMASLDDSDDRQAALSAEKIEWKATAYFTPQQWVYFQRLATKENQGRPHAKHKKAAGRMKIRGTFRMFFYLAPPYPNGLLIESTSFWRYQVGSIAPGSLARSQTALERFRMLRYIERCRDRDVIRSHPGQELSDKELKKARPKQRSIDWLAKQIDKPLLYKFLDQDPLTPYNIRSEMELHAAWIVRYFKPIRKNIMAKFFNVSIDWWEELARNGWDGKGMPRGGSMETLTSATYTRDASSDAEEDYGGRHTGVIRRTRAHHESDEDQDDEDEPSFTPRKQPSRAVKTIPVRVSQEVIAIDSDDSEDELPQKRPGREAWPYEDNVVVEIPIRIHPTKEKAAAVPSPKKRTRDEEEDEEEEIEDFSDEEEEEEEMVAPYPSKRPRTMACKAPRFAAPPAVPTLDEPEDDENAMDADDALDLEDYDMLPAADEQQEDDDIVEITQAEFAGLDLSLDLAFDSPPPKPVIPTPSPSPSPSPDYSWSCPHPSCAFSFDLANLDSLTQNVLDDMSASDYVKLQPAYIGEVDKEAVRRRVRAMHLERRHRQTSV